VRIGDVATWTLGSESQNFRVVKIVGEGDSAWIWGSQGESEDITMVVPSREVTSCRPKTVKQA